MPLMYHYKVLTYPQLTDFLYFKTYVQTVILVYHYVYVTLTRILYKMKNKLASL